MTKKLFLLVSVVALIAIAYFNMRPTTRPYVDESEVQAYLNLGLEPNQYLDESDVQAYTPTDIMEDGPVPAKKKTRYYPVRNHKPRPSTLGFSITPPPGSNWYEKLDNDSLVYVKINKSHRQYAIFTEAREVHLDKNIRSPEEIQRYVKREKEIYQVSSSFQEPQLTVRVEDSSTQNCIRYSQSYQDHGMKGLKGNHFINVDTEGLFCLHPENDRAAIDMSYVEKSLSDTQVKSYSSEGEKFLTSLAFR